MGEPAGDGRERMWPVTVSVSLAATVWAPAESAEQAEEAVRLCARGWGPSRGQDAIIDALESCDYSLDQVEASHDPSQPCCRRSDLGPGDAVLPTAGREQGRAEDSER